MKYMNISTGYFWKVLTTEILTKLAKIFSDFLGSLEEALFRYKLLWLLFGHLWEKLDHFYVNIWSHWQLTKFTCFHFRISIGKKDEGFLSQYRQILVGNKRLLNLVKSKGVQNFLSARKFEPHLHWLAPRLEQGSDVEAKLCAWDNEFREKFFQGNDDDGFKDERVSYLVFENVKHCFQHK